MTWFSQLGTVVPGVPNARRKPALPIGHCPPWQALPAVLRNHSVLRKDHQGHHKKVPKHFHPLTDPCRNLSVRFPLSHSSERLAEPPLPSGLCPLLQTLRRRSTRLHSLTDISFSRGFVPVKTELLIFLATASPRHRSPRPHQLCPRHSHPRHDPQEVAASPTAGLSGTPRSP